MRDDWESSQAPQLRVEASHEGAEAIITVEGELADSTAERFIACVLEALDTKPRAVTVDAHGVTFTDSSGLGPCSTLTAWPSLTTSHSESTTRRPGCDGSWRSQAPRTCSRSTSDHCYRARLFLTGGGCQPGANHPPTGGRSGGRRGGRAGRTVSSTVHRVSGVAPCRKRTARQSPGRYRRVHCPVPTRGRSSRGEEPPGGPSHRAPTRTTCEPDLGRGEDLRADDLLVSVGRVGRGPPSPDASGHDLRDHASLP
jgi:hypothetical protein